MGGDPIRHEPTVHDALLQDALCEHYFRQHGWIVFFLKIRDYNEEIPSEFMHSFNKGEATIRGLRVIATEQWIAEVTRLPQEGELFLESKDARSTKAEFTLPIDGPLTMDKQGTRRVSLPIEWPQVALYVMKYITCKGRYGFICNEVHYLRREVFKFTFTPFQIPQSFMTWPESECS